MPAGLLTCYLSLACLPVRVQQCTHFCRCSTHFPVACRRHLSLLRAPQAAERHHQHPGQRAVQGNAVGVLEPSLLVHCMAPDSPAWGPRATGAAVVRPPTGSADTHSEVQSAHVQVFCASDSKAHEEMRQACFDYLALGGVYSGKSGLAIGTRCDPRACSCYAARCQTACAASATLA